MRGKSYKPGRMTGGGGPMMKGVDPENPPKAPKKTKNRSGISMPTKMVHHPGVGPLGQIDDEPKPQKRRKPLVDPIDKGW
jgi:hypothetical protein